MANIQQPVHLDIELYIKDGRPIPGETRSFLIRIDGEKYPWDNVKITGNDILKLAGKGTTGAYEVIQHFRFKRTEVVEAEEIVDLATRGVERFSIQTIIRGIYTVYVNARPHQVRKDQMSYWEVVQLAFPGAAHDNKSVYTVTYTEGADPTKPKGQLTPSSSAISIQNNTKFNVTLTNRS